MALPLLLVDLSPLTLRTSPPAHLYKSPETACVQHLPHVSAEARPRLNPHGGSVLLELFDTLSKGHKVKYPVLQRGLHIVKDLQHSSKAHQGCRCPGEALHIVCNQSTVWVGAGSKGVHCLFYRIQFPCSNSHQTWRCM